MTMDLDDLPKGRVNLDRRTTPQPGDHYLSVRKLDHFCDDASSTRPMHIDLAGQNKLSHQKNAQ